MPGTGAETLGVLVIDSNMRIFPRGHSFGILNIGRGNFDARVSYENSRNMASLIIGSDI